MRKFLFLSMLCLILISCNVKEKKIRDYFDKSPEIILYDNNIYGYIIEDYKITMIEDSCIDTVYEWEFVNKHVVSIKYLIYISKVEALKELKSEIEERKSLGWGSICNDSDMIKYEKEIYYDSLQYENALDEMDKLKRSKKVYGYSYMFNLRVILRSHNEIIDKNFPYIAIFDKEGNLLLVKNALN